MKTALLPTFFTLCVLLVSACGGIQTVMGPDGNIYYEPQKARDTEDHCRGVCSFSRDIAMRRSHLEFRDGKKFIIPANKEALRTDLNNELAGMATFTPEGKRNYNKIVSIFDRIVAEGEFDDKTPEEVCTILYNECMEKMANKTWFPELASEAK